LTYTGTSIPLSLAVVVAQECSSTDRVHRVFTVELFHPDIDRARERLASAGFDAEMEYVALGRTLRTVDPFGNTLYLTDKTYESYDEEG
jgi:hypothetical protein